MAPIITIVKDVLSNHFMIVPPFLSMNLLLTKSGELYLKKESISMEKGKFYYTYSEFLKKRFGEKVYKLPVNLPVTCPNRVSGNGGCIFCSEDGTGFEALTSDIPVREQLLITREKIEQKYHAHKFIAYFQNYTNTFLPIRDFTTYVLEAAQVPDIVEIAISTRPDCIRREYLDFLKKVEKDYHINICIELGLQTVNYHTLDQINRGHGLAEFLDAVNQIKLYGFDICAHVILNLPNDNIRDAVETAKVLSAMKINMVKIHSLYIAKNTLLCEAYENGTITLCEKNEYIDRLITFLEYLSPDIVVERLFSRIPEETSVFCNWGISWWKLRDEVLSEMKNRDSFQGKKFHYLNGDAFNQL